MCRVFVSEGRQTAIARLNVHLFPFTHFILETPKKGYWQTVQTQIRRCKMRRLIRVSTFFKVV